MSRIVALISSALVMIQVVAAITMPVMADIAPPQIASFTPESGYTGDAGQEISVTGTHFTGTLTVDIASTSVTDFTVVSDTAITFRRQSGDRTGQIVITTPDGVASSTDHFIVRPPPAPTITSFSPNSAYIGESGQEITITGTHFTGTSLVGFWFNGPVPFTVVNDTTITFILPSKIRTSQIYVGTAAGIAVSTDNFTIKPPPAPTITSFSPDIIYSNQSVSEITITGTHFTGATGVVIFGNNVAYTVVNDSTITATLSGNRATSQIYVGTAGGWAFSEEKLIVMPPPAPTITSFTPSSGNPGDVITITGTNFNGTYQAGTLSSYQWMQFVVVNDTTVTMIVPSLSTFLGQIVVITQYGVAYSKNHFGSPSLVAPTISSFTPDSAFIGEYGQELTITGTDLTGTTAVYFKTGSYYTSASYQVINSSTIKATVPSGTTTGQIQLASSDGNAASTTCFMVLPPPAPVITSFTYVRGGSGYTVTVTGTHFTGASQVGTTAAGWMPFNLINDTTITIPNCPPNGQIVVVTPGGWAASAELFTVPATPPPTITILTPDRRYSGDALPEVTITGNHLTYTTDVRTASYYPFTFSVINDTTIKFRYTTYETAQIFVMTPTGVAYSSEAFLQLPSRPPVITSVTPDSAYVGEFGQTVTIKGLHFSGTDTVGITNGGTVPYTVVSDNIITFVLPAGYINGQVFVRASGGVAYSADYFTFLPAPSPSITSFTPDNGKAGDVVTITGSYLFGATSVDFNGTSALFTVLSGDSISATLPEGATTGKITVTTPGGSSTSADDFTVWIPSSLDISIDPGLGYIGALSGVSLKYDLTGPATYTGVISFDDTGKSSIGALRPGSYILNLYGSHWLRRTISGVDLSAPKSITASLTNGDADGDNQVNLFDYVVLDTNFGTADPMADLDGDGQVNLYDYVIIDQNFGALGDGDGKVKLNPIDGAEMVWISAGEFIRGSDSPEIYSDEWPQRQIYLDGYWMYKYEVTVAQYRAFCLATSRSMPDAPSWGWQDKHPMENVSWNDAVDYASWAGVSLPTEAQWEKAARGTDGREYPWGNAWDASKCANLSNSPSGTKPVGSYQLDVSPYGCMDMAGNVWEWCADLSNDSYYQSAPSRNPPGPTNGYGRVMRGGCWYYNSYRLFRCARRGGGMPADRDFTIGFRCARTE